MYTLTGFFKGLGIFYAMFFCGMFLYIIWCWLYKKPRFKKVVDIIWKYLSPVLDAILTPIITLAFILWVIYQFIALLLGAEPQM